MKTGDYAAAATESGHALICRADEVAVLASAGKGVMLIKLEPKDVVVGAQLLRTKSQEMKLENEKGTVYEVSVRRYAAVSRGGKGHQLFKRGKLVGKLAEEPELPSLGDAKPQSRGPKPN